MSQCPNAKSGLHEFGSRGRCNNCGESAPPIPSFLRRTPVGAGDGNTFAVNEQHYATQIADLTARLAEAERERDAANFDKSRMLDERQIFLKSMDELRARLAEAERERNVARQLARNNAEGAADAVRASCELRAEVARLENAVQFERNGYNELYEQGFERTKEFNAEKQARETAESRLRELREAAQDLADEVERRVFDDLPGLRALKYTVPFDKLTALVAALAKSGE